MNSVFVVLFVLFLVLVLSCVIFFKLWRANKKRADIAEGEVKKMKHRIDLEKNQKEIFSEVFEKKEKAKKEMAGKSDQEAYEKIMEDFRK